MSGVGRRNPRAAEWRSLARREGRATTGLFLAEGPHLVEEALRGELCRPVSILVSDDYGGEVPAATRNLEVVRLAPKVFEVISDAQTPQGIAVVCRMPAQEEVPPRPGRWILAEEVQDPGHVGTLARTAHAAGWSGLVLGPLSADPYSPKAVRASQGAIFHVPAVRADITEWATELQHLGCRVVASVVRDGDDYRRAAGEGLSGLALLVGSEARGLSDDLAAMADARVTIPLPGGAESLSLPVAAGILVFSLIRESPE